MLRRRVTIAAVAFLAAAIAPQVAFARTGIPQAQPAGSALHATGSPLLSPRHPSVAGCQGHWQMIGHGIHRHMIYFSSCGNHR